MYNLIILLDYDFARTIGGPLPPGSRIRELASNCLRPLNVLDIHREGEGVFLLKIRTIEIVREFWLGEKSHFAMAALLTADSDGNRKESLDVNFSRDPFAVHCQTGHLHSSSWLGRRELFSRTS